MRPTLHLLALAVVTLAVPASPALAAEDPSLKVAVAGDGVGTVVSDPPGIRCPGDCEESYPEGTLVDLVATAEYGSALLGWSTCEGVGSCSLVVDGDLEVEATFDVVVFPALCVPAFNQICGTSGNDILIVDTAAGYPVTVFGGSGDDRIVGGPKGDVLRGGDGADRIFGRGGPDAMYGGAGPDSLVGGPGADRVRS